MKKTLVLLVSLAVVYVSVAYGAMDHSAHMMPAAAKEGIAHEEVVQGVKGTFKVMTMKDAMKAMNMEMPKEVKETHHIMAEFVSVADGKAQTFGEANLKIQKPDKTEQVIKMMAMHGHFGADVDMSKKGKYGIMLRSRFKDGNLRDYKFWYEVK